MWCVCACLHGSAFNNAENTCKSVFLYVRVFQEENPRLVYCCTFEANTTKGICIFYCEMIHTDVTHVFDQHNVNKLISSCMAE